MTMEARRPSLRAWQPVELSETRGLKKDLNLEALFECYPQAFLQIAEYYHSSEELLRQVRAWSCFFNRFCVEDPNVATPYREVRGIVTAIRTLLSSERARSSRLLFCCVWIMLFGVVCPILSVSWEAGWGKESRRQGHGQQPASHVLPLTMLGLASLLAALSMPTSVQTADAIVSAVGRMGGDGRGSHTEQALRIVSVAIGASRKFVVRIKFGLAACSALSILISVSPFLGSLVACYSLLVGAVIQARRVGLDVKLSLQQAFRTREDSPPSFFELETIAAMREIREELDQNLLNEEPEREDAEQQASSIRILVVTCFLICAARSMILWISDLRGCGDAKKDVHDAVCLPSLVAMVCPGFLAIGSMIKLLLGFIGCCEGCGDWYQGSGLQHWLAITGTTVYLWCPVLVFGIFGALLPLKVLADLGKSPLADVFSLWRLPVWEELIVISMVAALWLAMLLLSIVLTTCIRMLKNTGWPSCLMIYAGSCLVWEVLLALLMFKNGEDFLPRILVINSAVSTGVISTICIGFIIYGACQCMTCNGERPVVGYGYLWG